MKPFVQCRTTAVWSGRLRNSCVPHVAGHPRSIEVQANASGAIDYVDVVKNNVLYRRISECDVTRHPAPTTGLLRTKLFLELGWGPRRKSHQWNAKATLEEGESVSVEPRFRGRTNSPPCCGSTTEMTWGPRTSIMPESAKRMTSGHGPHQSSCGTCRLRTCRRISQWNRRLAAAMADD